MRRVALAVVALAVIGGGIWWWSSRAQQANGGVALDGDDIGGVVRGPNGPEAGVWVIAETTDLPTKFARIVVTDDQGRYVVPDVPNARYKVWARGYGLVDSQPRENVSPGQHVNLTAVVAPDAKAAAEYYPASSWLSLLQMPPASAFPGTGEKGNDIPTRYQEREAWLDEAKSCIRCHQMGTKITREIPAINGKFDSSRAAWEHRIEMGQQGISMNNFFNGLGRPLALSVFTDWTDRIAAGELPPAPPRPRGVERNVVVTLWDWAGPEGYNTVIHGAIATDKRQPTVNANGLVFGTGDAKGTIAWVDPVKHVADEAKVPTLVSNPTWASNLGPMQVLVPSPYWGNQLTHTPIAPHNLIMDQRGRVWFSARIRGAEHFPDYCKPGAANTFVSYHATRPNPTQVAMYDPSTKQFSLFDTCFGAHHVQFAVDADNTAFLSGGGNVLGWINTRVFDETKDLTAAQGWCPAVLDANGDGRITKPWTEPDQPLDPGRDRRVNFGCYGVMPNQIDGSVWCADRNYPGTITRIERGPDPPLSCKAERYEVPPGKAYVPLGIDFDSQGIAWVNFSGSGHVASFDRRTCKVLNGPAATGQHCVEGWTFYPTPLPKLKGETADADYIFDMYVDRFNTIGLGEGILITPAPNSDALLALNPQTGEWTKMVVPYPLGFLPRYMDGRIDDPAAGWKGRGQWSAYTPAPNWHIEGGKGTLSKVVRFQLRPDPLAK